MITIYRINRSALILSTIFFIVFAVLSFFFLFVNKEVQFFQKIIYLSGLILFSIGIPLMYEFKVFIDDKKIEIRRFDATQLFRRGNPKNISLCWNEIEELKTVYILYPENPIIILQPKPEITKKKIEIMMFGMPISLLKNIIICLPPNTKIGLYTYLQRKLEGKQTWFFKKQEFHKTDVNYWLNLWKK